MGGYITLGKLNPVAKNLLIRRMLFESGAGKESPPVVLLIEVYKEVHPEALGNIYGQAVEFLGVTPSAITESNKFINDLLKIWYSYTEARYFKVIEYIVNYDDA